MSVASARPGLARMGAGLTACLLAFAVGVAALAANFPALTGRVVDQANIIPADQRIAIEAKLADLESKSGIQLVVATVTSLDGQEIEPYANELFRAWKLGERTKNNGVLLLVAPNERRVRIEVGYGLEGTLTDALSQVIISNAITPRFKSGDFAGGITRGVDDIIIVLTTDASEWQKRPSLRVDRDPAAGRINWLAIAGIVVVIGLMIISPAFRWMVFGMLLSGRGGAGGLGGGGRAGRGGFGGGGGSSGGGGASGRW
ncbi:YgcG family protein [Reyranella sp.]|uniref:TPM domain-containing protein n=1 Tax=Reyranella sp. TaxID=1929291 RepID=UPI0035266AF2